ncbi:DUF2568 domain-containing protein [Nocardia sp. NPDC004068]|uniref:DUF2568 domain-containing protein n=1 Tax=Nocardia sp. NPDC004068 TaxID=3364303 RepID=UPI00367F2481
MTVVKGANMALMFVLELGVLASAIAWGLSLDAALAVRILAAAAAVAVFVLVWSQLAAGGKAPHQQYGWRRFAVELGWFGGGAVLAGFAWSPVVALVLFAAWAVNGSLRVWWRQV